ATFTGGTIKVENLITVSHEKSPLSDQWFQWTTGSGNRATTMFYDRRYGTDQQTGYMDISLVSTASGQLDAGAVGSIHRITDASMPPSNEFPAANGHSQ